jgi:phosphoglycerate-specific signal transduction histidine kinase
MEPATLDRAECAILTGMDHLAVLREKIGHLRDEIAHLQELNDQYRRHARNETEAQVAHGQRQERLQEIQQELVQLAGLGRRVLSVEQRKAEHRSRLDLAKKAS